MQLKVKSLVNNVDKISYNKEGDAALDLRASGFFTVNIDSEKQEIEQDSYEIKPGERILVKTGIEIEIPKGCFGSIRDRSGLAFKNGLHVLGGVIDETYRGEIGVILINLGKNSYTIKKNERIAQMVIQPYARVSLVYVDDLNDSIRGKTGFGASGKH